MPGRCAPNYEDEGEFVRRVDDVQRPEGYLIVGAFEGRPLPRGRGLPRGEQPRLGARRLRRRPVQHPYGRRRGHGRALLEWCAEEARPARLRRAAPRLRGGGQPRWTRTASTSTPGCASRRSTSPRAGQVIEHAERVAGRAERELEALVGVSSPSGDVAGAEEALAIVAALLPERGRGRAARRARRPATRPDLLARLRGTGAGAAAAARPRRHGGRPRRPPAAGARDGERLTGSGTST